MLSVYYAVGSDESPKYSTTRKTFWVVAIIIAYVVMIGLNYLSTAGQFINSTDNTILSNANPTYVTPDGATFSIWGFIYLFETIATVYQALPSNLHLEPLVAARPFIALAYLSNALWLYTFAYTRWWLSLAVMLLYLGALIQVYRKLDISYGAEELITFFDRKYEDLHTWKLKTFIFIGYSINTAWIAVASGVNATTVLRQEGWQTDLGVGGSVEWALMWIVIFASIASVLAITRGDVAYSFGCAWALAGISRMQSIEDEVRFPIAGLSPMIAQWASIASTTVTIITVFALIKNMVELYYIRPKYSTVTTVGVEVVQVEVVQVGASLA